MSTLTIGLILASYTGIILGGGAFLIKKIWTYVENNFIALKAENKVDRQTNKAEWKDLKKDFKDEMEKDAHEKKQEYLELLKEFKAVQDTVIDIKLDLSGQVGANKLANAEQNTEVAVLKTEVKTLRKDIDDLKAKYDSRGK